jgi:hypothetical protein
MLIMRSPLHPRQQLLRLLLHQGPKPAPPQYACIVADRFFCIFDHKQTPGTETLTAQVNLFDEPDARTRNDFTQEILTWTILSG